MNTAVNQGTAPLLDYDVVSFGNDYRHRAQDHIRAIESAVGETLSSC